MPICESVSQFLRVCTFSVQAPDRLLPFSASLARIFFVFFVAFPVFVAIFVFSVLASDCLLPFLLELGSEIFASLACFLCSYMFWQRFVCCLYFCERGSSVIA
jgi:hypothetical protein